MGNMLNTKLFDCFDNKLTNNLSQPVRGTYNSDWSVNSSTAIVNGKLIVTCFYYSSIPVTNELHLASRESKSC